MIVIVAMQLRCGEAFNNHVIANFPRTCSVPVSIWRKYGQKFGDTFF